MKFIKNIRSIFKMRNPAILLSASTISRYGDWFYLTAFSALVTQYGGLRYLAFFTTLRQGMSLFLQPLIGTYIDSSSRKKDILIFSDLIRFFLMLFLSYIATFKNPSIELVLVLSLISSFFGILFDCSRRVLLPLTVKEEVRGTLNALDGSIGTTSLSLAPALGGIILSYFGREMVFFLDALSFLFSGFLLYFLTFTEDEGNNAKSEEKFLKLFTEGAHFIYKDPLNFSITLLGITSHIAVGSTWIFVPHLSMNFLDLGDSGIGHLMSAVGLGSIIGMIMGGSISPQNYIKSLFAAIFALLFVQVFWKISTIYFIGPFVISALLGFFANIYEAPCWTVLQNNTPPEMFSRVFAFYDSLGLMGVAIGSTVSAYYIEEMNMQIALNIMGILMFFFWLLAFVTYYMRKNTALKKA